MARARIERNNLQFKTILDTFNHTTLQGEHNKTISMMSDSNQAMQDFSTAATYKKIAKCSSK